jgi:hypothetical protein
MIHDYTCEKCGFESHNGGLKFTVHYQGTAADELLITCPYCGYGWREKCHKAQPTQITPKAGGTRMSKETKLLAARILMFAAILGMARSVKTMIQFAIHYYRGETPAWFLFCMCAVAVWMFNIMLDVREELREAKEQNNAR